MRPGALLLTVFALALPAAQAGSAGVAGSAEPVLGRDWKTKTVARYDPLTLQRVGGPSAPAGFFTGPWAWDAARARLALTRYDLPQLRIVDAVKMRVVGDVKLRRFLVGGGADAVTWVGPSRLLALTRGVDGLSFALVDAQKLAVAHTSSVHGALFGVESTVNGLVALIGPEHGIGRARLVLAGADGSLRTLPLPGVSVGRRTLSPAGSDPRVRSVIPGFAVDPAGTLAVAVTGTGTAVAVDLRTLAVATHDLVERRTQRVQKSMEGPQRYARWAGDGLIAVSGSSWSVGPGNRVSAQALGVRLVDTRTWTTRTLDPGASSFSLAPGVVLAYGGSWSGTKSTYTGVHAYGLDGALRWSLYEGQDAYVPVRGPLAYVQRHVGSNRPLQIDVVDPATGAVLNSRTWPNGQAPPTLYADAAGTF